MASQYNKSMGTKLKALCLLRGLDASACADVAGVSTRTWYRWENRLPTQRIQPAFTALKACEKKVSGGNQLHIGI